jgi:hypothetical protein
MERELVRRVEAPMPVASGHGLVTYGFVSLRAHGEPRNTAAQKINAKIPREKGWRSDWEEWSADGELVRRREVFQCDASLSATA